MALLLAIDQGTTSNRAIAFTEDGRIEAVAQKEFAQHYPDDGWVEHDANDIWHGVVNVTRAVLGKIDGPVAGIGITNQRETTVIWDKVTGEPIHRAIVWQDRRTSDVTKDLFRRDLEHIIVRKTGLVVDPYFSATKAAWILDRVEGAREKAVRGELAFGTIDCFLLWKLTGGKVHATDITNACRTSLMNIETEDWDDELLEIFRVPRAILPDIRDCASDFGVTDKDLFGAELPILGMAGDQQAAAIGQACIEPGLIKSTYGTGCFVILNTGEELVRSRNRLLTTVAMRLNGRTSYALEGAIFIAGAAVQWLRDGVKLVRTAPETQAIAESLEDNHGVYLVPAFVGLGAPHWRPDVRGGIFGLTRNTGQAHIVRAAIESVGYQTHDLFAAMADDGVAPQQLRIDGGMVANDWFDQFLADILDMKVQRPDVIETTALGAALLAGVQAGVYGDLAEAVKVWRPDREFVPSMDASRRKRYLAGWKTAIDKITA